MMTRSGVIATGKRMPHLVLFPFFAVISTSVKSLSLQSRSEPFHRRHLFSKVAATLPALAIVTGRPTPPAFASIDNPLPQGVSTVILDSPEEKPGVELYDVVLGGKTYPAVRTVQRNGAAASRGVQEGMVILPGSMSKGDSAGVMHLIEKGPYPMVLQFYNLAADYADSSPGKTPAEALALALNNKEQARPSLEKEPEPFPLDDGAMMSVRTIRKPENKKCLKARRGDLMTINYEARIASAEGPVYDSTEQRGGSVTFQLGQGQSVAGVEIGLAGMCVGEVRTLDIPSSLGYGVAGSPGWMFNIPGRRRLWWEVELVDLKK